jgi:hypothetical protein
MDRVSMLWGRMHTITISDQKMSTRDLLDMWDWIRVKFSAPSYFLAGIKTIIIQKVSDAEKCLILAHLRRLDASGQYEITHSSGFALYTEE